jgi:hypothetical protein
MTNVLLELIPEFVSGEQINEPNILSRLSVLNSNDGFADVLSNGKQLYLKVVNAENNCKKMAIAPISVRISVPPETYANLAELARQAQIGIPMASKVAYYRSLELRKDLNSYSGITCSLNTIFLIFR